MNGKKYYRLTPDDLREHPIWVLSMDVVTFGGGDEDWDDDTGLVVPLPSDPAVVEQLFANCICHARAWFVAANGRRFTGMIKCWAGDGVESCHPAIVTDRGRIDFYFGIARPSAKEMGNAYAELGLSAEELFPLSYGPDVAIPDAPSTGELRGFSYLESQGNDHVIKTVR